MMKKHYFLFCLLGYISAAIAVAQPPKLIQSGPMVGYSTMREVLLWVQTTEAADVYFEYAAQDAPTRKMRTATVRTNAADAFIAKAIATVEPSKRYTYQVVVNGKTQNFAYPLGFQSQTLWQWRTDPPAFKFAIGSCFYVNEPAYDRPSNPYGGEFEILNQIIAQKPDFMVWLGDNTYLREADWDSRTGIYHRYTHTRSQPLLQPLLANVHHYALWDDHDYGPNDSDRSYEHKQITLEAFKKFWGNPSYIFPEGVTGKFSWGDVDFFLLDDRWYRSPEGLKSGEAVLHGKAQLNWLIDALAASQAPFKMVCSGGQILTTHEDPRLESYNHFPEEKLALLQAIAQHKISGVMFLTGDRHHTELSKMERSGTYPLYDLTISPLTAGAVGDRAKDERNTLRVADTYFGQRNFAVLEVNGARRERVLTITVYDVAGKEVWKREIKASELR